MKPLVAKLLPPGLALLLTAGLAAQMRSMASTENAEPFHAAIRELVDDIPVRAGNWEGADSPVPAAAGTLLRPNRLFARRYRDLTTGRAATLVLVHCRDSRDMSGHWPPNCYRGSGWTQSGPPTFHTISAWGRQVPVAEYAFTRTDMERTIRWSVYNFFVLPTGGMVTDMGRVQSAGGDYRSRPYGAAQIQVIIDTTNQSAQDAAAGDARRETLHEMLELLGPVVDRLQLPTAGGKT